MEIFKEALTPEVELEIEFAEESAFLDIRNTSVFILLVYLKNGSEYNATPIVLLQGERFARPIVTDAIKCLSAQGGNVEVISVPTAEYSGVGATGATGDQGPQGDPGAQGIQGETGPAGSDGADAFIYIAYASDASGTDFTTTFDADLDYIAILATDTEIVTPVVGDFAGLWKNYKGATGIQGEQGETGATGAQGEQGDPGADALQLQYYESSQIDIVAGWTNVAHGLGIRPDFGFAVLRCIDTDGDYATGDEIPIAFSGHYYDPNEEKMIPRFYLKYNSTNFTICIHSSMPVGEPIVMLDDTGALFSITASKWKIIFKALTRPV